MLKLLRRKDIAKKIFWALLILIIPAFVLWGAGSMQRSREGGPKFVGLIDNKKVSFDDFAESLAAIKCQIILVYFVQPQLIDEFMKNKPLLGKMAWDRIIMLRLARKGKIKVPDEEVIAFIRSHPIFVRNGAFDERIYSYILRNNLGIDMRGFEEMVRENLAIKKLNDDIIRDIRATDEEVFGEYTKGGGTDKAEFEKEKSKYREALLFKKRNEKLENWLRNLESQTKLNIDFNDYEKYYK